MSTWTNIHTWQVNNAFTVVSPSRHWFQRTPCVYLWDASSFDKTSVIDAQGIRTGSYWTFPPCIHPLFPEILSLPLLSPIFRPPSPHLDSSTFGNPHPQVVLTELFCEHSNARLGLVKSWRRRRVKWKKMGLWWPHSQESDCRVALLLRSGRTLIPWIYTRTTIYSRICDCRNPISPSESTHGHGPWFNMLLLTDPYVVTAFPYSMSQCDYALVSFWSTDSIIVTKKG